MDYSIKPNFIDRSLTTREERAKWRSKKAEEMRCWLAKKREECASIRSNPKIPTIKETFKNESVLITGATGVLGKILIEKLLWSCPDIKHLYLLVRPLKNQTGWQRIEKQFTQNIYDRLRSAQPDFLAKVSVVQGDSCQVGLGLSDEDRATLHREVGVIFHGAATVRFDEPLKKAIMMNVRGTREVVELAKGMKRLKAFVHVSTTYANTKEDVIREEVYPTPVDWRTLIRAAEETDEDQFNALTNKLIGYQPNTYTFTKNLAEGVVDAAKDDIPVIITRPSVVIFCANEPIKGWTDNLYGVQGVMAAVMKGVLRFQYGDRNVVLDYIPTDSAIRSLIVTAWIKATKQKLHPDPAQMDVVNMTVSDVLCIQYFDVELWRELGLQIGGINDPIRYPRYTLTNNKMVYYVGLFFSHILVAMLLDMLLRLSGKPPRLMKVYRGVHLANTALLYFMLNNFRANTENLKKTLAWMKDSDLEDFDMPWDWSDEECLAGAAENVCIYKFNCKEYNREKILKQYHKLFVVEVIMYAVLGAFILWATLTYDLHGKALGRLSRLFGATVDIPTKM